MYHIEFVDAVRDYLAGVEGLTDPDRATIVDSVIQELSHDADRFLVRWPLAHESLCFRYDYAYPTAETVYQFDFVADASFMEMGVVRIVYVECLARPMS